jgi:hypothetical protein
LVRISAGVHMTVQLELNEWLLYGASTHIGTNQWFSFNSVACELPLKTCRHIMDLHSIPKR